ncbi:MAG TPA: RMD1 family protein [Chitinophagaceae bacterium]|nr:RMD1 family protein [Chitinophagaceae bacterium]
MMNKVIAYQVADSIDIKNVKSSFKSNLRYSDSSELFYETGADRYVYVFRYGVVSFFNYDALAISAFLQFVNSYCRNFFVESINDELIVETGASENKISHNKIEIINADREALRMIMLNVSQSVALDYYTELTDKLLEETNYHTQLLEKKGRLAISGSNLKKFIGKTLLLKNRIAENLYIFDSPPETWEDEQLDKLHNGLIKNFDLQERFRNVSEGLGIVKDNLELFKDILQYRNSTLLEWIIIALIAIEVINFLIDKFF